MRVWDLINKSRKLFYSIILRPLAARSNLERPHVSAQIPRPHNRREARSVTAVSDFVRDKRIDWLVSGIRVLQPVRPRHGVRESVGHCAYEVQIYRFDCVGGHSRKCVMVLTVRRELLKKKTGTTIQPYSMGTT